MTVIAAFQIQPDTVLLLDGAIYFVEGVSGIDEYDETLSCSVRRIDEAGFLAADAEVRSFHFEDRVALKG